MAATGVGALLQAMDEIRDRVVTGESFTDALKDYDRYFDVIYVAMVRVGEVTGTLGDDGVFFFNLGKVNTAHGMASEMVRSAVERMDAVFGRKGP